MLPSQNSKSVTPLVCYWHLVSCITPGETLIDQFGLQSVSIHQIGGWLIIQYISHVVSYIVWSSCITVDLLLLPFSLDKSLVLL